MQKKSWLILLATTALFSCSQQDFKKGEEGLEYKIISGNKGKKVNPGEFMELEVAQLRNRGGKDSLLQDTRLTMPYIESLDSASMPPSYYKILSQVHENDSLVIRLLSDTAFKKNMEQMPIFFKKGDYLLTTIKVNRIFKSKEEADKARTAAIALSESRVQERQKGQIVKDQATIEEYLKKNNITAVKAPKGTYVQILTPGTGNNVDTSVVVKTNYTGKTMEGKVFDSNTDSTFRHVEPFLVNMTNDASLGGGVIAGWKDGLTMLNKGAKARFYIPSPLAYGEQGAGMEIRPNTILVFDIDVVDVLNRTQAKAAMEEEMKKMKENMKTMQQVQQP